MYELQRKEKEETPRAFLPSSLLREAGLGAAGSRFAIFPKSLQRKHHGESGDTAPASVEA